MGGIKKLNGQWMGFHGAGVWPAVNGEAWVSCVHMWRYAEKDKMRCLLNRFSELRGISFLCSLQSFEALMPLMCRLCLALRVVQSTPAHE